MDRIFRIVTFNAVYSISGGFLFPTGLAFVLIGVWYFRRRHWSALFATVLLIPAAIMLISNLGCMLELFQQNSHIGQFVSYYGMGKIAEILASLLLAGVSLGTLAAVAFSVKSTWVEKD
jgi:hypothetical protein